MRGKIVKRLLSVILAGTLVLGCMTGCGDAKTESTAKTSETAKESTPAASEKESTPAASEEVTVDTGITYPLAEGGKLTIATVAVGAVTANYNDWSETPFWKAWQEYTGVELELIQLADNTALNLLYASGELPDIIIANITKYTGGAVKAIEDMVVQPINDYMEFAPDLQAALDSDALLKKSATTSEGDIIGFPMIQADDYLNSYRGIVVRADWLKDLNMAHPETPEEFYDMLKVFKEEKGAEYPLSINMWSMKNAFLGYGAIAGGFGLPSTDYYQVDGTVHYGYAEQEYKDVLTYLNKLYNDGLLDPNWSTNDDATVRTNLFNGVSGVTEGASGSGLGVWLPAMEEDPVFDLVGIKNLAMNKGEKPMGAHKNNPIAGTYAFITPQCKDIELAAKFLNYGYTEEGHMFFNFGIEGESYNMVDGKAIYTDLITNNEKGWTMDQTLAAYCMSSHSGPFVKDRGYTEQYSKYDQQREAISNWMDSDKGKYMMPAVTIDPADSDEYSRTYAEIGTYVEEMLVKFVMGTVSLDKFESEYLPTLETLGVKRCIEIQQAALDEFNAR